MTSRQNFDVLLVPPGHVSRSPKDTYYANHDIVLRTHTSAHQSQFIASGEVFFFSPEKLCSIEKISNEEK